MAPNSTARVDALDPSAAAAALAVGAPLPTPRKAGRRQVVNAASAGPTAAAAAPVVVALNGGGGVGAGRGREEGGLRAQLRDYFLDFLPPHVRRKGLQLPPLGSMARKFVDLLSFPYFPFATLDLRSYAKHLGSDTFAGLTCGIMMVPQSMAYAVIANLPPIYGLYASTIAGFVYCLFGTSGQLSLGAVVLVSLFMAQTYTNLGVPLTSKDKDPVLNAQAKYHTYVRCEIAAVVSFAAALILCGMALFRVGSLMKFVSPSVLTGFVTGSAVYIFISQSKYIWGFKVPRDKVQLHEFKYLFSHIRTDAETDTMAVGLASFFALLVFNHVRKGLNPRIRKLRQSRPWLANTFAMLLASATLIVIVIATAASRALVKGGSKINVIGEVPAGFNKFELPSIKNTFYGDGISFGRVVIYTVPIALLTYLESVSVARKYSVSYKYPLDMTQELWALGLCCLFASFFKAYPPGGGFSRTALNNEIGAKTPFANVVASLFVTLVLVAFTSLLKFVPMAVLAAVICANIISLFDFHDMWRALWVAPVDFVVMMFTFLVTVLWNVEKGLEYGIILSVVILLLQFSRLDMDSIGHLNVADDRLSQQPADAKVRTHFRPLDSYPSARQHPAVKVMRLRANLFFGNVGSFRDEFFASLAESGGYGLRAVIIDASGMVEMDLAALAVIDEVVSEMQKQDVEVYVAAACPRVINSLEAYDLLDEVGGLPLAMLDVGDVFWAVLGDLEAEEQDRRQLLGAASGTASGKAAVVALAERRAGGHPRPHKQQSYSNGGKGVVLDEEAKGQDLEETGRGTVNLDDKEDEEDGLYGDDAAQDLESGTAAVAVGSAGRR